MRCELVHKRIIVPLCDVEKVLHAHYLAYFLPLRELARRHITEAEMTDQSLALEFGEHGERLFNRSLRRSQYLTHAQIHHVEFVHAEISKIVLNCLDQFLARESVTPGLVVSPAGAYFGDNQLYSPPFRRRDVRAGRIVQISKLGRLHQPV
jgi:hypothetical protein